MIRNDEVMFYVCFFTLQDRVTHVDVFNCNVFTADLSISETADLLGFSLHHNHVWALE